MDYETIKAALLKNVRDVIKTKDEHTEAAILRLEKAVQKVAEKIDKMADAEAKSAKVHADAAINFHKNAPKSGSGSKSTGKMGENIWASRRALERIVKMGSSPRTFWVGIGHYHSQALKQLTDAFKAAGCCGAVGGTTSILKELARNTRNSPSRSGGAIMGVAGTSRSSSGVNNTATNMTSGVAMNAAGQFSKTFLASFVANSASILTNALGNGFELNLKDAYNGAFRAANNFRMEVRSIQQATEGFVESNRAAEPTFDSMYHTLRASGVTANKVFEMISKAQKLGIRNAKISESIIGTATNTASILAMNADAVNDTFINWHQQLGMSTVEIAMMGQNMKEVAKQSGVIGKRLESALASADNIATKLRNAGSFTATAGKNVTAMMVEFEKFGISKAGQHIVDALSSRHSFLETDPITRGYLERVARQSNNGEIQQRVRGGTLLHSPQASKEFYGAMEKDLKRMLGHFGPAIEKSFEKSGRTLDLAAMKMSDIPQIFDVLREQGDHQLYGVIGDLIKRQTGMDVGEITKLVEAGQNATKTTTERIEDMKKELANFSKGTANYQQKEQQILAAQVNEIQGGFTTLMSAKKSKGTMTDEQFQEAFIKRISESMGPERAKEFAKNLTSEANTMVKSMVKRADVVGINANKIIKELGGYRSIEDLAMGISKGDSNAQETMNKLIQRVEQQEKVAADPIESIQDNVKGIHDWLTTGIFGALKGIGDTALSILGWVGLLSPIFGSLFGILKAVSIFNRASNAVGGLSGARGAASGARGASMLRGANLGTRGVAAGTEVAEAGAIGSRGIAGIMSRITGPLQMLLGGVIGYFEAEEAKRMKSESVLLGVLTGGAKTGSMASGLLGVEKGSKVDKTLGVVGGGLWGAAAGAAIGSAFFGVGAAPGAAIGAIVGSVAEMVKIVTDGTTLVYDILIKPFDAVWGAVKDITGGVWDILTGILSLNITKVWGGLWDIITAVPKMVFKIASWILNLPVNLVKLWAAFVKSAFGAVKSFVADLASNEWFGPIFEPFLEVFDLMGEIGQSVSDIFSEIWSITDIFSNIFEGSGFSFKDTVRAVSKAIGFLVKESLFPFIEILKWTVVVLKEVVTGVQNAVSSIKKAFSNMWDFILSAIPGASWFLKKDPEEEKLGPPKKIAGFADGSSNITEAGLAYIHKNEAIIPGDVSFAKGEPLRGEISSNTINYDDVEDLVAKQVYGESPDGTAMILPSMDAIAEYLTTTQFMLLENMVSLMEAIKSNTASRYSSNVIESDGGNSRMSMRPGVKSMARDLTRGKWDLTFADNSPGAVTTEGRGGSA